MSYCKQIVLFLLAIVSELIARPEENVQRMALRRQIADQDKAASYVYRSDNNGPPHIYYLTADDLNRNIQFHQPQSSRLVYYEPQIPELTYASAYPTNYYPPKPTSKFIAAPKNFKPSPPDHSSSSSSSSSESASNESEGKSIHSDESKNHSDESKDHSNEGGQSHEDNYHKKHGKKAVKDYKSEMHFQKGSKGKYDKENEHGGFSEEGETDSKKYDEEDKYHDHEEEAKSKKGGKFDSKKHHKKGSKSKGLKQFSHKNN